MIRVGILGVGTIAQALVRGFCTDAASAKKLHFFLSPRNRERADALREAFPEQITVCEENQQVVDAADWVFLTLLPRDAEAALAPLSFRPEQKILTIMSDHPVERVRDWTGPVAKMVRMVPLPFAAMHIGPIAIYPADAEVREMFAPLGNIIGVEQQNELSVISAQTAIMSAFYHLIYDTTAWGESRGLPKDASLRYMTSFFEALSVKASRAKDGDVRGLAYEMTPGGLNEMVLMQLLDRNAFGLWKEALDRVWDRLNPPKKEKMREEVCE